MNMNAAVLDFDCCLSATTFPMGDMPVEDGYALIRKVRALGKDKGGDTPAVALTAYARSEDRVRALRHGFQMHVAKPVEAAELVMVVASLTGRAEPSD